jgi:DNA end-binding protein Ku
MAALERSLAEAKGATRGGGRRREAGDDELADLSREELYERAQKEDVPGRSSMSKRELIDALGG